MLHDEEHIPRPFGKVLENNRPKHGLRSIVHLHAWAYINITAKAKSIRLFK